MNSRTFYYPSRSCFGLLTHLETLLNRKVIAVAYMRVSTPAQESDGNLKNRTVWLLNELQKMGVDVDSVFTEVGDAKSLARSERSQLYAAVERAQALRTLGDESLVAVVTDTRNRFLRGKYFATYLYRGSHLDDPGLHQWHALSRIAGDVPLATVLHPKATYSVVKSHEQEPATGAGRRIGRPPKRHRKPYGKVKLRREKLLPRARELFSKTSSMRAVARELERPESTIRRWLS